MTRDEMKRLLDSPVMRAWADGGTLQFKRDDGWVDVVQSEMTPLIKYLDRYRIKPEPKYRPWTPEEAVKHLGKWVYNRLSNYSQKIVAIHEELVLFHGGGRYTYLELMNSYKTDDGKPCGTEVVDAG